MGERYFTVGSTPGGSEYYAGYQGNTFSRLELRCGIHFLASSPMKPLPDLLASAFSGLKSRGGVRIRNSGELVWSAGAIRFVFVLDSRDWLFDGVLAVGDEEIPLRFFFPKGEGLPWQFKSQHDVQAKLPAVVDRLIPKLEALTRDHSMAVDLARRRYEKAKAEATRLAKTYAKIAAAEQAWQSKDFKTIVALLTPIEGELSQVQRQRLKFSRKKVLDADL